MRRGSPWLCLRTSQTWLRSSGNTRSRLARPVLLSTGCPARPRVPVSPSASSPRGTGAWPWWNRGARASGMLSLSPNRRVIPTLCLRRCPAPTPARDQARPDKEWRRAPASLSGSRASRYGRNPPIFGGLAGHDVADRASGAADGRHRRSVQRRLVPGRPDLLVGGPGCLLRGRRVVYQRVAAGRDPGRGLPGLGAADHRNSPLSITEIPQGTSGVEGLI